MKMAFNLKPFCSENIIIVSRMVQTSTVAGSARIFQLLFSIVSLALNGKLTTNKSSLSSLVSDLNSNANSSLSILHNTASDGLSLTSSGFTLTSQPFLSLVRYFTTDIEHELPELNNARFGINKLQTSYLAGISGSEIGSIGLWFGTFVYQTAKYGSWDCSNPENFLSQYNLTGDALKQNLNEFLGVSYEGQEESLQNASSNDEINELLGQLWNLTSEPINISKYNSSGELTKSELMVQLTQDCYIKKASIGVSFLGLVVLLVSSGAVSYSFMNLYQQLKTKWMSTTSDEEKKADAGEREESDSTPTAPKKYRFGYSYANIFPSVEFDD